MKRFLMLLLVSLPASAQLAAPSFGLSAATYTITFGSPISMSVSGPTGATICIGVNVTPTATTAGTCNAITGEFTYTAAFTASTGTFNAIATQVGQTNSSVATLPISVPTFGTYTAGAYSTTIGVPIYADYIHLGGAICYTTDGSTPTESGNACTHGTTYSVPVSVSASLTLKALLTKSGQSDTSTSAVYTIGAQQTWFVRTDGGTYYDANVTAGQCNGKYDAAYPGTGTNQNCAVNDVRYLWSDNSGNPNAWIISGGDTVVIRGCTALAAQTNPSNPNCRLGYDNDSSGSAPNQWCGYGNPNTNCYNPPVPSGSAAQPTTFLGACAYGTYTCTPINNKYPYTGHNETQLFGGFGLVWSFNLNSTNYVTIEGIELTTHNGVCTSAGSPAYPAGCSSGIPYSDFATEGFWTNSASSNLVFQDVYVHGFNAAGFDGPIGGPITMTRVFSGFNEFAGWDFDDGYGTNDGVGSTITANYVTMIFNGCYEQYPITATYPAQVCYDTNSSGFGDSWSGQGTGNTQNSVMASFTCDYCVDDYNTKDGFIGPHVSITTLTISNSVAIGNMGSNWKWGGEDGYPSTVTFQNNLTVNNCVRMSVAMTGVPTTYNQYLTGFCRAGGNGMASAMPTGSTWNIQNNTFVSADSIALYIACANPADTSCPSTVNSTNNVFLGYSDPNYPNNGTAPTLYYFCNYSASTCSTSSSSPPEIGLVVSHNDEYGMRSGTCPSTTNGVICSDPLLVNEPAQTWPGAESDLDVFNPFLAGNSFYPTSGSPLRSAGVAIGGLTEDYYSVTRPNPPTIGGVEYVVSLTSSFLSGFKCSGCSIH